MYDAKNKGTYLEGLKSNFPKKKAKAKKINLHFRRKNYEVEVVYNESELIGLGRNM